MPAVKYIIEPTNADRKQLKDIVAKGTSSAKSILHVNILLASDCINKKQLNNLGTDALVLLLLTLQDQLVSIQGQLDVAKERLANNNRQIESSTEQIRILDQRQYGKKSNKQSSVTAS